MAHARLFLVAVSLSLLAASNAHAQAQTLDFGELCVGESKRLAFKIDNVEGAPMVLDSLKLSDMAAPFTFDEMFPLSIPPARSQTVNVTATPSAAGTIAATATVTPHDPAIPPILINLTVVGIDLAAVVPAAFDFGRVKLGTRASATFVFRVRGNSPVPRPIIVVDQASGFAFDGSQLAPMLQSGSSNPFVITFAPNRLGPLQSTLLLQSPLGKTCEESRLVGEGIAAESPDMATAVPSPSSGCSTSQARPGSRGAGTFSTMFLVAIALACRRNRLIEP